MAISYKLEHFEGPLDLLLHLIEKNKVSIYDIPIVLITEQYLEYVSSMETEDLNVVSEFLVMAATLIDIKCRMLLPVEVNEDGEEEDPRVELMARLLEYKMYKYMSYELRDRQIDGERMMFKGPDIPEEVKTYQQPFDLDELLDGLTLAKLNRIFKDVMRRQNDKIDPVRSIFGKIEKEEVTVDDKMEYLNEYIRTHHKFSFRNLLMHQKSKLHIVVTFLAVLEMMKIGAITIEQEHTFGEIMITSRQDSQSGERWNTENED